jgi:hypothetical protein
MKLFRSTIIAGVLVTLLLGEVSAQVTLNERRSVSNDGIVEILIANGTVQILGWNEDVVAVSGILGKSVERVEFGGDAYRTTLQVLAPQQDPTGTVSDLKVFVPAASQVEVGTVGADIDVSGVTGMLFLQSVEGDIRVKDRPKEIDAKSLRGEMEFAVDQARIKATSTGGRIILRSTNGEADISTVSGNVVVEGGRYKRGRFKTVSGDLRFDARIEPKGVFEFTSHSGNIDLFLPRGADADFLVSTYKGQIENDFQMNRIPKRPVKKLRKKLTFSTKDGMQGPERFAIDQDQRLEEEKLRARVMVDSFSGNLRLKRKE